MLAIPFRRLLIGFGTPIVFVYLGVKQQRHLDKVLKAPETKDLRGGGLGIGWTSLVKKHKDNLPFVAGMLGGLAAGSIIYFDKQIYGFLVTALPSTFYNQFNNRYFVAIERTQNILKIREATSLIEEFNLSPRLSTMEKIEGYKLIILDILTFDSQRKVASVTIGFASLLAFLFTGDLIVFGRFITALMWLIKEGKISRAVAKMIVQMARSKGVTVPEELEELVK